MVLLSMFVQDACGRKFVRSTWVNYGDLCFRRKASARAFLYLFFELNEASRRVVDWYIRTTAPSRQSRSGHNV